MKVHSLLSSITCVVACAATTTTTQNNNKNDASPRYCEVEDTGEIGVCENAPVTENKTLNEKYPPRPVEVEFINDSSANFHVKFIDTETLQEDLIIWNMEPKIINKDGSTSFYSETIDSFTGHEFDVIHVADAEEFRIRLIIDDDELLGDDKNKAVFTITDDMIRPTNVIAVEFINDSSHTFHVNFIDSEPPYDEDMIIANLQPQAGSETVQSFPGHEFAVYDEDRTFRIRVVVGDGHQHGDHVAFRITDDMIHPQKPVDVEFINDTTSKQAIHINYIDPDFNEEELIVWNLSPKRSSNSDFYSETIHSFTGHDFVAYDEERTFRLILRVDEEHIVSGDKVTFAITDDIIASI